MNKILQTSLAFLLFFLLIGCVSDVAIEKSISISLEYDGKSETLTVPDNSTVQQVLSLKKMVIETLDKINPPTYTILTDGMVIQVIRIREEFETVTDAIPFERQIIQNESMEEGQTLLIQAGKNGLQQIIYRKLFEDEMLVSKTIFQVDTITVPTSEITMVGIRSQYSSYSMPGTLVYLAAGNAWKMEETTSNRKPLVTTGDLDGYIFNLSSDGKWLLATRKVQNETIINKLWVFNVFDPSSEPIDLGVENIIHFADWIPNQRNSITYSTVEKRTSAPGWQANNDLWQLSFNDEGTSIKKKQIIDSNSGGTYGWWGQSFAWSPDGTQLAYARPDSIGLVNFQEQTLTSLVNIQTYDTHGDWAWVPQITWSPDSRTIFYTDHNSQTTSNDPESDPTFGISAFMVLSKNDINVLSNVGMFAKPLIQNEINSNRFQIGYFNALFPNQSDTSHYRLVTCEQDGSNPRTLFPLEGMEGMEPKIFRWAPSQSESGSAVIGLIFKGNLWFVDAVTGNSIQITGDGLISSLDWK